MDDEILLLGNCWVRRKKNDDWSLNKKKGDKDEIFNISNKRIIVTKNEGMPLSAALTPFTAMAYTQKKEDYWKNLTIDQRFEIIDRLEKNQIYEIQKYTILKMELHKPVTGFMSDFLGTSIPPKLFINCKSGKQAKYIVPYDIILDPLSRLYPELTPH